MKTIAEEYARAIQHQQAGRLREAEEICRHVLVREPQRAEMWHLLGMIAFQCGRLEEAIQSVGRAVQLDPKNVDFWNNLGVVFQSYGKLEQAIGCFQNSIALQPANSKLYNNLGLVYAGLGKLGESAACYQQALVQDPGYADAMYNWGLALAAQGNLEGAIDRYRRAIELRRDFVDAFCNLGTALCDLGRKDEAEVCYRRGVELRPDDAKAHNNLGTVLKDRGQLDEAIASFERAIECEPPFAEAYFNLGLVNDAQKGDAQKSLEQAARCYQRAAELKPDFAQAHYELGNVFRDAGRFAEALAEFQRAVDINPKYAEALNNLGTIYQELGDSRQAIGAFRRAIDVQPDSIQAHNNLANAFKECGQIDEAAAIFGRAVELAPELAAPHWNAAMLTLLQGDFERGWPAYEWRWKTGELSVRGFTQPRWQGEPLAGKTILLYHEQGLGDTLQFIRYASLVKRLGATVVVECLRPLVRLLSSCPGIDALIVAGDPQPGFDFQTPMLSIPAAFQTNLATIPREAPYLFADKALVAHWRVALREIVGFRIGINWRGRANRSESRRRDIPLDLIGSLAEISGVRLISLQKGAGQEDLRTDTGRLSIIDLGEFDTEHGPFMDTAAIMQNLDLVITSDTSVCHLAGALGVPVWVALPFSADWRWLLGRSDSPWYPTMRLFRQKSPGDWEEVFAEVRTELWERLGSYGFAVGE